MDPSKQVYREKLWSNGFCQSARYTDAERIQNLKLIHKIEKPS